MSISTAITAEPVLEIGVIADCQYDTRTSSIRKYDLSTKKLQQAITDFNHKDLSFVVHLGDFIDQGFDHFATLLSITEWSRAPFFHVLGNHDFSVEDHQKLAVPTVLGMPSRYHSFVRNEFRFIILDSNDISLYAYPADDTRTLTARKYHSRYWSNKPEWNGAFGQEQLSFVANEIKLAERLDQKVILFSHHPVFPPNRHNAWNETELITLLSSSSNVVMFINGHNHSGNYGQKNGIHFVTFKGMVDTTTTAYGILRLYSNKAEIVGRGRQDSKTFIF